MAAAADTSAPIPGASDVSVLVLAGYGLNCEAETAAGFRMAGARADIVHVADLLDDPSALTRAQVIAFGGGFSFGDHIASGRVLANRMRYRLGDGLRTHVDRGGFVLGICNGFQTLVKMGLLPGLNHPPGGGLGPQQVSVTVNDRIGYRNAWVRLRVDPQSACVFTQGIEFLECPSRHGEGKLVIADDATRATMTAQHLVPVHYVDAEGVPTTRWPDNPSGTEGGAAGLCDPSGRVFGLMPHPEAYLYPENHPAWLHQRDAGALPREGLGLQILRNGVRAAAQSL